MICEETSSYAKCTSCIYKEGLIPLKNVVLHKILTWATVLYRHGQVSVEMHKILVKKIVNYLTSTWLTLSLVQCVLWVFYLMVPHYDGSRTLKYFHFCILKPSYFALFVKVYKVLIKLPDGRSYFIFRRYNEFHQLCDKVQLDPYY